MRALIYIAAVFLPITYVDSARILGLFPHTGKSHQMVFDPLLKRLAENGHHLTVVSFFPMKNPPANYTTVDLEKVDGVETFDLMFYENPPFVSKIPFVNRIVRQYTDFNPLAEMALNVCAKLVDWQPLKEVLQQEYDLLIVEQFNSDCMLGLAHIYGIRAPVIGILSSGLIHWSHDRMGVPDNPAVVEMISTSFSSEMNFLERLENTIVQILFKWWFRHSVQLKEQEILENKFGKMIDLRNLGKNVSMLMTNMFHSFNGVHPTLPGVVEVGGMHLDHSRRPIPQNLERFLNESDHGVVLFSLGSLIKTSSMPQYKVDIITNALLRLKQRVIWKFEDSDDEGTLIGNILRVKWIPQYDLLRHPKVVAFIAHGGLLGMTEAVSVGKPILVVPFFADQHNNGARAEIIGLGKTVSYEHLTEKSLYDAIQSVLTPEIRISARRASKVWRDRPADPLETAVYWVERVIRWPNDPLYSVARNLSFFEYYLIDVASVLLIAVILVIVILRLMLVVTLRFIGAGNGKEKIH